MPFWKIITILGVPGLALGVFYMLFKLFNFKVSKISVAWSGPLALVFLIIVGGITAYALKLYAPTKENTSKKGMQEDISDKDKCSKNKFISGNIIFDERISVPDKASEINLSLEGVISGCNYKNIDLDKNYNFSIKTDECNPQEKVLFSVTAKNQTYRISSNTASSHICESSEIRLYSGGT